MDVEGFADFQWSFADFQWIVGWIFGGMFFEISHDLTIISHHRNQRWRASHTRSIPKYSWRFQWSSKYSMGTGG